MKSIVTILFALTFYSVHAQSALLDSVVVTDIELNDIEAVTRYAYDANGTLLSCNAEFADPGYQGETFDQSFYPGNNGVLDSFSFGSIGSYYGDLLTTYVINYRDDSILVRGTSPEGTEYEDVVEEYDLVYNEGGQLIFHSWEVINAFGSFYREESIFYYSNQTIDSIEVFAASDGEELSKRRIFYYTYEGGNISKIEEFNIDFYDPTIIEIETREIFENYVGDLYTHRRYEDYFFSEADITVDSVIVDENGLIAENFSFNYDGSNNLVSADKREFNSVVLDWNSESISPVLDVIRFLFPKDYPPFRPDNEFVKMTDGYALNSTLTSSLDMETQEYIAEEREEYFYNQPSSVSDLKPLKISVFPNPTTERLFINDEDIHNQQYQIFDMQGRVVQLGRLNNNEANVAALRPGNYTIIINQKAANKRFQASFIKL